MEHNEYGKACETVVNFIIDNVANRTYNVGDKLPPERTLSSDLGVSRTTVREAVKVLNFLGFVDSSQGSGNYITNAYPKTVTSIMRVMYLRGDVSFENLSVFRQMLELEAFDAALKNITEDQKKELTQIVNLLWLNTDEQLFFQLDNRLHMLLIEASHNPLIIINYRALSSVTNEFMAETYHKTVSKKLAGVKTLHQYHQAIVDALLEGNAEKGRQAILDHFAWLR